MEWLRRWCFFSLAVSRWMNYGLSRLWHHKTHWHHRINVTLAFLFAVSSENQIRYQIWYRQMFCTLMRYGEQFFDQCTPETTTTLIISRSLICGLRKKCPHALFSFFFFECSFQYGVKNSTSFPKSKPLKTHTEWIVSHFYANKKMPCNKTDSIE